MRACIYTCVIGGYDSPKPQPVISGFDYLFFTDSREPVPAPWDVRLIKQFQATPALTSRLYKILPPVGYDYTIYIDGSVTLQHPQRLLALLDCENYPTFLTTKHKRRANYIEEAYHLQRTRHYHPPSLWRQVEYYKELGVPLDMFFENWVLCRNTKLSQNCNVTWWQELQRWQHRDQISLPYAVWKSGVKVTVLDPKTRDDIFRIGGHNKHPNKSGK